MVDTLTPPDAGQVTEPTNQEPAQPQDGAEPPPQEPPTEPPAEPAPLTPDEIIRQAEERAFQKTASWMGRRDKDLLDNISAMIDTRLKQAAPESPKVDPAQFIENPRPIVQQILRDEIQNMTRQDQQFTAEVIKNAAAMMDVDPLFADKDFGTEVVAEIQRNFGRIDKNLPPQVAAKLMVSDATTAVFRKKAVTKQNPLAGRQPAGVPLGGVTAPAKPAAPKVPNVQLSPEAKALADRWGYKPEDLARVFGT